MYLISFIYTHIRLSKYLNTSFQEENWIKEMENILLQGDIGHDLTTINLLLAKHKTLETEILGHESALQVSIYSIYLFVFYYLNLSTYLSNLSIYLSSIYFDISFYSGFY